MASTSTAVLCLALSLAFADAATLSAKKLRLQDYDTQVAEKEAPIPAMIEESEAQAVEPARQETDNSDSWDDNELDQTGLPPAEAKSPADTPIVHAKVKQVLNLIKQHSPEFNSKTTSQVRKDALLQETLTLSRSHMGEPGYNYKYCVELWSNYEEEARLAAFYECPSLYFPDHLDEQATGLISLEKVYAAKPSALKSAYLSNYFWNAMLLNKIDEVESMVAPNIVMWEENKKIADGKDQFMMRAPYIGWPRSSDLEHPETWECDATGCTVPIKAFHKKVCNVMAKYNFLGQVEFVHANLFCWR